MISAKGVGLNLPPPFPRACRGVENAVSEESEPLSSVTIAAAGDVHLHEAVADQWLETFTGLDGVDLILLAGDLTADGLASQAELLAQACRAAPAPVGAVLGNHDWHMGEEEGIVAALRDAGVRVLERESAVYPIRGVEIGVVGLKGFVGGFLDSRIPDFGEPLLRRVYAQTSLDVDALERELQVVEDCDVRVVLLHYSPTATTLTGEREAIWAFLGTDRLAEPIVRHEPDLVLHGHAHGGTVRGCIGSVQVWNVAAPLLGFGFQRFELDVTGGRRSGGDRALEPAAEDDGGPVGTPVHVHRAHQ
jgi:Icc-related predicted phosphoesterase